MLKQMKADFLRYHAPVWVCLLLTVVLLALPSGYEDNIVFRNLIFSRLWYCLPMSQPLLIPGSSGPASSAVSLRY